MQSCVPSFATGMHTLKPLLLARMDGWKDAGDVQDGDRGYRGAQQAQPSCCKTVCRER
jgi:hypothetical protein